jgi:hypothetical protein
LTWPITGLKEGMGLDVIDPDNNNEKKIVIVLYLF